MGRMSSHHVACSKCKTPLPARMLDAPELAGCPSCGARLHVDVFPSLIREVGPGSAGETILTDADAGCFYHPQKKAVIPCDNCGRFLCALCDVEFEGRHLCPSCLESGEKKGRLPSLEKSHLLMDDVALAVAILPLLFWPLILLTLFTAPTAIFLCVRHWNARLSLLPRSRVRFLAALLAAGPQVLGWVAVGCYLVTKK